MSLSSRPISSRRDPTLALTSAPETTRAIKAHKRAKSGALDHVAQCFNGKASES